MPAVYTYTSLPNLTVEAFQWLGDPLSGYELPGWATSLALHAPSDGTLHVPCWNGTNGARIGDWIVKGPTGAVNVVSNDVFSSMYDVNAVAVENTGHTMTERSAEAAEARAAVAKEKHEAAVAKAAADNTKTPSPPSPAPPPAKPAAGKRE